MNRKFIIIIVLLSVGTIFGQDLKEQQSKMLAFVSKTGVLIKFEDYHLPKIQLNFGIAEARIRKLTSGVETKLFYQISKEGKYDTKTASVAYEDILEMQKALENLKSQSIKDTSTNADYIENKFVTDDGFQVGYFISKGKINWYLILEKYGNGNTVFIKDVANIDEAFNLAKSKMDELKQKS